MKIQKRILSLLVSLLLIASISGPAFALDIPGRGNGIIERETYTLYGDELAGVLDAYRQLLEKVQEKAEKTWYADFCCGVLKDVDNDGYPEMLLLYSPDGNDLEAMIACRTGRGIVESCKQHVCALAGGASGSIAVGEYENVPVVHIIYQNSTKGGTCSIGWDDVYNIDGEIAVYCTAAWSEDSYTGVNQYEVNRKSDVSGYRAVTNGITALYKMPGNDDARTLSELAYDIANYTSHGGSNHTQCRRCGGTGRCSYCSGTGNWLNDGLKWMRCPFCAGLGTCSSCFGRGYTD